MKVRPSGNLIGRGTGCVKHIALLSGDATPKAYWVTSHEPQVKYRFSVEKYECKCGWNCATHVHLVFGSSVPCALCVAKE